MKFKGLLFVLIILFVSFSCGFLISCESETSLNGEVGLYNEEIEFGKYFYIPKIVGNSDITYTVKGPDGKNVKVSAGYIQLTSVGKYTIDYANGKSITVTCTKDVSAPMMTSELVTGGDHYVGDVFIAQGIVLEDPSEVDYNVSYKYKFYYEDETTPLEKINDDTILLNREGQYKIVVPAQDCSENKNYTEYVFYIYVVTKYYDVNLFDEENNEYKNNNLALFTEDGYLDYLSSSIEWGDRSDNFEINTKEHYGINDGDNKNVLFAYPEDGYSQHFVLKYEFFKPINKDDIKYLYIKFYGKQNIYEETAGSLLLQDYSLQLYAVPYSMEDSYISDELDKNPYSLNPVDGEWHTSRISVDKLFESGETELKGIKLCITGNLYIDKIWFDNEDFIDENRDVNVLCDFDENNYLYQISSAVIGDGAVIKHYSAQDVDDVIIAEEVNNVDGGIILIQSKNSEQRSACINIKFFEKVKAEFGKKISLKIYYDSKIGNKYYKSVIAMRKGTTNFSEDNVDEYTELITSSNVSDYLLTWKEITIETTVFADAGDEFDEICLLVNGSLYIDTIEVK